MADRTDIAALGAGWNPTLEWYARAVGAMQQRPIADRTSWLYIAAIHGIDRQGWQGRGIMPAGAVLPSSSERRRIWNQCQHSTWYFLPWHRGYIAAFEAIVAKTIVDLGGPPDWALPYWNYLDDGNTGARRMPQAFLDATLPDGTPNPLSKPPRSGTTVLGPQQWFPDDITLAAMGETFFTAAQGALGFGGGFDFGGSAGAVEFDPHNAVHVLIGGVQPPGFMSDPSYAALDPIFWVHHCNIDRLWAAWQAQPGNTRETGAEWSNGPSPSFELPGSDGTLATFRPGLTLPGGTLAPTYDDLTKGTGVAAPAVIASVEGAAMPADLPRSPPPSTVVASNASPVTVGATEARTSLQVPSTEAAVAAASGPGPQRLFLNLENIRGAAASGVLTVTITSPSGDTLPAGTAPHYVKTVALFGLAKASDLEGSHGGNGLSLALDVTEFVKELAHATQATLDQLDVRIEQPGAPAATPITVERIKLYAQPAP